MLNFLSGNIRPNFLNSLTPQKKILAEKIPERIYLKMD